MEHALLHTSHSQQWLPPAPAHVPLLLSRRARVKGLISYSAPFGGAVTTVAPRITGQLTDLVPPELLQGVTLPIPGIDALVRDVTWNTVKGMASLAMLLPYSAAYVNGTDPVSA
jgi:hypothetical protein